MATPIIAILDGLPLEHHDALDGRLMIDDPNEHAMHYSGTDQQHGTAMASLVLHGDLSRKDEEPLKTPVFVRPILVPKKDLQNQVYEVVPGPAPARASSTWGSADHTDRRRQSATILVPRNAIHPPKRSRAHTLNLTPWANGNSEP